MKFLVFGAGLMAEAIVEDLSEQEMVSEILLNDINKENIENCKRRDKKDKVRVSNVDVRDIEKLIDFVENEYPDVVINALPQELSVQATEGAIEAGIDVADLAFEHEHMNLDEKAKENEVTVIPGCGVAPGLSNMLSGYGVHLLDDTENISIEVGGLPVNPKPPLEYRIVFSLESVFMEYTVPAKIVEDGELKEVEALSGLRPFETSEIDRELESFYTFAITTLPYTFEDIPNMEERTLRYKGHVKKINTLRECGLLDKEPIEVEGVEISPRKFMIELLTPQITLEEGEKDLTIMRVEVSGFKDEEEKTYTFDLLDYYSEENNMTSMARTTGYTGSIVSQLLAQGKIEEKGIYAPEKIGLDDELFDEVINELFKRNVNVDGV